MKEDTILKVLPWDVRSIIQKEKLKFEYLQEIRLREGKPLIFLYHDTEVIPGAKARRPYLVTKDNIREMLEYISNYSLYACEQEMRQGFITIEGGHRVGLSGQAIMENGKVKSNSRQDEDEIPGYVLHVFRCNVFIVMTEAAYINVAGNEQ